MPEALAVEFKDVGKMYRLYKNRSHNFLDVSGIGRLMPWWRPRVDHFWALRGISFQLQHGARLGIIGRNGAGKTTLLKLMTGNLAPTEGCITVDGSVQALLEAGAGFHPEFTGYENVEASLIHNGMSPSDIKQTVEEIADFTELSEFMGQPFKTYSAGMEARLVFTTATTIKPDILIIDEILGAGDAYFAVKSQARMKTLVESGASILLVSHALEQIVQFCEEAIWLERGQVVARGPSLEVVKA
jgi:lipopolysaccharide transport system ATP-binding protein